MKKIILSCLLSTMCISSFAGDAFNYARGVNQSAAMTNSAIRDCHYELNGYFEHEDGDTDPYDMKYCLESKGINPLHYHGTSEAYLNNSDGQTFIQYADDEPVVTYQPKHHTDRKEVKDLHKGPDAWP